MTDDSTSDYYCKESVGGETLSHKAPRVASVYALDPRTGLEGCDSPRTRTCLSLAPPAGTPLLLQGARLCAMGLKQKKALAKKESGDLKVDKTSKAGYDRSNVAEVIKRLKKMAKEDTNRFDKMGLDETLERLEASERVAASVDAALARETERKRALLSAFLERGLTPPAPETLDETPTGNVSDNLSRTKTTESDNPESLETVSDEDAVKMAKTRLAETQASSRRKLAAAKRARQHNEAMLVALDKEGVAAPEEAKAGADM